MRAEAAVPLGRARFTELSLLVWVATFAVTGFVAVLATETSSFKPTAVVVSRNTPIRTASTMPTMPMVLYCRAR